MASSTPATSLKVTTVLLPRNIRALDLPKLMAWLLLPCAWRNMNHRNTPMSRIGNIIERSSPRKALPSSAGSPSKIGRFTHDDPASQAAIMFAWTCVVNCAGTNDSTTTCSSELGTNATSVTSSFSPFIRTALTLPASTCDRNDSGSPLYEMVWGGSSLKRKTYKSAAIPTTSTRVTSPLRMNRLFKEKRASEAGPPG